MLPDGTEYEINDGIRNTYAKYETIATRLKIMIGIFSSGFAQKLLLLAQIVVHLCFLCVTKNE